MMAVSITPNHQVAAIVASAFYAIFNLFSGFLMPKPVSYFPSPQLLQILSISENKSNCLLFAVVLMNYELVYERVEEQ